MLQLELGRLNASSNLIKAEQEYDNKMYAFRNYLRYDDSVVLKIDVPQKCPVVKISPREVLDIALKNNPLNYSIERQLLEAKQRIAQARVDRGFKADIYASVGFTGSDNSLSGTYQNFTESSGCEFRNTYSYFRLGKRSGTSAVGEVAARAHKGAN